LAGSNRSKIYILYNASIVETYICLKKRKKTPFTSVSRDNAFVKYNTLTTKHPYTILYCSYV
jgi:hypothetical protein